MLKSLKRFRLLSAVAVAGFLVACVTTPLDNVWKSPEFHGEKAKKVLVIGISTTDGPRRIFEDAFVADLRDKGLTATPSYMIISDSAKLTREKLEPIVAKSDVDAVLVTRAIHIETGVSQVQGAPMYSNGIGFYGWYESVWVGNVPSLDTHNRISFETTFWDAKSGAVIWSGINQVNDPNEIKRSAEKMAGSLVSRMRKDGLI